jgi:hypothetical protein
MAQAWYWSLKKKETKTHYECTGSQFKEFLKATPVRIYTVTSRDINFWYSDGMSQTSRLVSYMEQKLFLPFVPEFSAEFSVPPEFSSGVTENIFEHRLGANLQPSD